MDLPLLIPVRQLLYDRRLEDIDGHVDRIVRASALARELKPGARIAVAVGSRGVANIDRIAAATIATLRALGAAPFVVPAMGSHGGATAEGQIEVLESLGVTEARVGAPIRSAMDVVRIGTTGSGMPVYTDRNAFESDGVVVINRVKKHTDITAPIESGLMKMLAIGLGKKAQADLIHSYGAPGLRQYIPEVARVVLARAPIKLGLASLENGHEDTAEIHALEPDEIEEREKQLLLKNKRALPRLPFDEIDILIVEWMGKEISGCGMDTNVLGRVAIRGERELRRPRIRMVVVLDLTEASHGNAIGLGLADLTTERLVSKVDWRITNTNGLTSGFMERCKTPMVLPSDRAAIEAAFSRLSPLQLERPKVARIRSTLHLAEFAVTEPLLSTARRPLAIVGAPAPLVFDASGTLMPIGHHVHQPAVLVGAR